MEKCKYMHLKLGIKFVNNLRKYVNEFIRKLALVMCVYTNVAVF